MGQINQIELLTRLGRAAFGSSWKASLADSLQIVRPTITDWTTGKKPIPVGVWADIKKILEDRNMEINSAIKDVSTKHMIVVQEMARKQKAIITGTFAEYLLNMSDSDLLSAYASYKKEQQRCNNEYPNDVFADLLAIKDALDFNICVRDINKGLDFSIAESCAFSFLKNKRLASSFGIDDELLIERLKEIVEEVI